MFPLNGRLDDEEEDDDEAHADRLLMAGEDKEEVASDKDALSLVSEDSELSVGHENASEAERNTFRKHESKNLNAPKKYEDLCKDFPKEPLINPFIVANAIQIPVPVMLRTHSTPFFHQELLRNSHLYAEELVMQQMQLMTAARVNALTKVVDCDGKSNLKTLTQISALTEMSRIAAAAYMATANATKKKQVQNQTDDNQCICTYHPSMQQSEHNCPVHMQRSIGINKANNAYNNNVNLNEPSLKFSIDNILKSDFGRRMDFVNKHYNCHNEKEMTKNYFQSLEQNERIKAHTEDSIALPASMDLSNLITCAATTVTTNTSTLNFCNTLSNICTNSNDSLINSAGSAECISGNKTKSIQDSFAYKKQQQDRECKSPDINSLSSSNSKACSNSSENEPIVWPAWVYCTRYSDRPSSGALNKFLLYYVNCLIMLIP